MSYHQVGVTVSEGQKKKIKKALEDREPVLIRLDYESLLGGNDILAFTKRQIGSIEEAKSQHKGITIKMSKTQVNHNLKVGGGFLSALLAMLPTIAKTLGISALSGLVSAGAEKVLGSGLFLKKGGCICRMEQAGEGLYLKPYLHRGDGMGKMPDIRGISDGVILMPDELEDGDMFNLTDYARTAEGRGLLLGKNSPFKNIPILSLFL